METSFVEILKAGGPAVLNNGAAPAALLANLGLIGHHAAGNSVHNVAAFAVVQGTTGFVLGIFNFLMTVPMAQISHATGAGRFDTLPRLVATAFGTAVTLGLVCSAALYGGLSKGGPVLDLMGTDPDVRPLVLNYLHGRLPGVGLTFVNRVAGSILVGKQRLRLATAVNALMAAVDVAGNAIALQVFNRGLFASGLASSAAAAIGAVLLVPMSVGLAAVRTPPRPFSVQSAWTDYDNDSETNSYQAASGDAGSLVGSPSASVTAEGPDSAPPSFSVAGFLRSSANMIIRSILLQGAVYTLSVVASRIGAAELAAHQVVVQLWSLVTVSYLCDGFADVGTMIGGRLLGEERHVELSQLTTRLCVIGTVAGIVAATVLLGARQPIIALLSSDPAVVAQLANVWLLTAAMQPVNAFVFVSDGLLFAHQAFGYIRNLMLIGCLGLFAPALAASYVEFGTLAALWAAKSVLTGWRCLTAVIFLWDRHTTERGWRQDRPTAGQPQERVRAGEAAPLLPGPRHE